MYDLTDKKIYLDGKYFEVYYPNHPRAKKNGCVRLHILVAEDMLGRNLRDQETVHHRDGNTQNNEKSNLMVFATNSDHITYHKMQDAFPEGEYVITCIKGVYKCQSLQDFILQNPITTVEGKRVKICPQCGAYMIRTAKLCRKCSWEASRKVQRPNRNTLKEEIRKVPMVQIAAKYGVSDNAVRKWCQKYGLPYKAAEIKKTSVQEWDTI